MPDFVETLPEFWILFRVSEHVAKNGVVRKNDPVSAFGCQTYDHEINDITLKLLVLPEQPILHYLSTKNWSWRWRAPSRWDGKSVSPPNLGEIRRYSSRREDFERELIFLKMAISND
jgi:hypothetical protein